MFRHCTFIHADSLTHCTTHTLSTARIHTSQDTSTRHPICALYSPTHTPLSTSSACARTKHAQHHPQALSHTHTTYVPAAECTPHTPSFSLSHTHTGSLFLTQSHTHTGSLFLTLSHTHTQALSFSLSHTHTRHTFQQLNAHHTHTLSLTHSLSLSLSHTHSTVNKCTSRYLVNI